MNTKMTKSILKGIVIILVLILKITNASALPTVSVTVTDQWGMEPHAVEPDCDLLENNAELTLTRSGPTTNSLSVHFSTSGAFIIYGDVPVFFPAWWCRPTADGRCFPATSVFDVGNTIVFDAGESSIVLPIHIYDDGLEELLFESHTFTIEPDSAYSIGTASATIYIQDSPVQPATAGISAHTVWEGGDSLVFHLGRGESTVNTEPTGRPIPPLPCSAPAIHYSLGGTAQRDVDYTVTEDGDGYNDLTVYIHPISDTIAELPETVILTSDEDICRPAVGFIYDQTPMAGIWVSRNTLFEKDRGNVYNHITATVSRNIGDGSFYSPLICAGTATPDSDYTIIPSSIYMGPGTNTITIEINGIDDGINDQNETLFFGFEMPSGYKASGEQKVALTIWEPNIISIFPPLNPVPEEWPTEEDTDIPGYSIENECFSNELGIVCYKNYSNYFGHVWFSAQYGAPFTNGGFELGLAPWKTSPYQCALTPATNYDVAAWYEDYNEGRVTPWFQPWPYNLGVEGSNAVLLGSQTSGSGTNSWLSQSFEAAPGPHLLQFQESGIPGTPAPRICARIYVNGVLQSELFGAAGDGLKSTNHFLAFTVPTNYPGGSFLVMPAPLNGKISFWLKKFSGDSGGVIIDNVTLDAPLPPTDGFVVFTNASAVTIGWTDNSDNETGFTIQRRSHDGLYADIASVSPNTTQYVDSTITTNGAYFYRVFAYNAKAASGFTDELSVYAPQSTLQISGVRFEANGDFSFEVHGSSGMRCAIYESTNLTDWSLLATNSPSSGGTTFTDIRDHEADLAWFYKAKSGSLSSEAVGFTRVIAPPGEITGIANQLDDTTNSLSHILAEADDVSVVYKYSNENNYKTSTFIEGAGWYPEEFTLSPGEGALFYNDSLTAQILTFVGKVRQGIMTNLLQTNYTLVSSIIPQAGGVDSLGLMNPVQGDTLLIRRNNGWLTFTYSTNTASWGTNPVVQIGDSFLYYNSTNVSKPWVRQFFP